LKVFPGALPVPYLLVGFVSSGSYSYPSGSCRTI
jgi:hypothetical protein